MNLKYLLFKSKGVRVWCSIFAALVLPRPKNQTKVLIFGQGRSGTTVLEDLLGSTGLLRANGEILTNDRKDYEAPFPHLFMEGLCRLRRTQNQVFHVKIYQLTDERKNPVKVDEFIRYLVKRGWKIIFLNRKDKVLQELSLHIAIQRGLFHQKLGDNFTLRPFSVDTEEFCNKVKTRLKYSKQEWNALKGLPFIQVNYEDDLVGVEQQKRTIEKILSFCGLPNRPCNTQLAKVNQAAIQEIVINFQELRLALDKLNESYNDCD